MKVSINYGLREGWWWVEDGNLHERALHCYRRVLGRLSAPVHHSLLPSGFVHGGPRSPVVSLASVPTSPRFPPRGGRGDSGEQSEPRPSVASGSVVVTLTSMSLRSSETRII